MTSDAFIIRKTNKEDAPARFEVTQATWRDAYRHIFTLDELEAVWAGRIPYSHPATDLREEFIGGFVAKSDGKIVGHITLALQKDGRGEIAAFYVRPERQGKGIGRALWDTALADLKARGCSEADVWVLARGPAVTFYEAAGCVKFSEGVFSLGEHDEAIWGYRIALT